MAALVEGQQVALFLLPGVGGEPAAHLRAIDNLDPVTGAQVLSRGLLGSAGDVHYVASPMLKHRFDLESGRCLDGTSPGVRVWPVRVWGSTVEVLAWGKLTPGGEEEGSKFVATHCPFCALQCGMALVPPAEQAGGASSYQQVEVVADPTFPVNEGRMCVKGWASVGLLRSPERLLQPLVRDAQGRLRPATWDAALDELASRLAVVRSEHGPEALGVFGSGALTNEKAYLL
ncbi:MAG: nitrite reductase (NAD(P)H) small subunit, partial [Acidimicrobiales bacterium]